MNYYGICGCTFILLLCVAILWASEHEQQVRDFLFGVRACLRYARAKEDDGE
jgi:hypothetical protein